MPFIVEHDGEKTEFPMHFRTTSVPVKALDKDIYILKSYHTAEVERLEAAIKRRDELINRIYNEEDGDFGMVQFLVNEFYREVISQEDKGVQILRKLREFKNEQVVQK